MTQEIANASPQRAKRRFPRFALPRQAWLAAIGVLLLLAFGWAATTSGPLAPTRVTVAPVITGDVAPDLFGIGTVEAQRVYLIGPTAAGRVRSVLVDVGDTVKAGQLLAEMDPVDLDAKVASTTAAAARGRSAQATAEALALEARSRRDLAVAEARRTLELGRQGIVGQSVVDNARQAQQSAEAQVAAAEAALNGARSEVTRLGADSGGAQQQRTNIRLSSPAAGVVISRDAEPGSTVVAGQSVLKLHDPASVWVTVRLDQGRSAGLSVGLRAEITLRSDARQSHSGLVVRVEPTSDSVTEERLARVAFDRLPGGVSTGEMAEVALRLPPILGALLISNASLRYRGAQSGVWVYAEAGLRFVPVKTGAQDLEGHVQVLEGLRAGDLVVVYSERDLTDNSRVTVVTSLSGKGK